MGMKWVRKTLVRLFVVAVLLYASVLIYLYVAQEQILFHPVHLKKDYKFRFDADFEELNLKTADNKYIHALYFKTKQPKAVILFFHGNTGALHNCGGEALTYVKRGYDVLMPDYRSFGKSDPDVSQEHLLSDALLAYDYLIKKGWKGSQISLIGRSLGSGPASYVASRRKTARVVLFTPYYSVNRLAGEKYPYVPLFVLRYPMETRAWFAEITCPVHIFHGTDDRTIPLEHALDLKRSNRHAQITVLEKAGHNNLEDFPAFHQKLRDLFP